MVKENGNPARLSVPWLGGKIRQARQEIGLSQEKVAEQLGCSWMTIHRWEKGDRPVQWNWMIKLGVLTNRSLKWFLMPPEDWIWPDDQVLEANPEESEFGSRLRRMADGVVSIDPNRQHVINRIVDLLLEEARKESRIAVSVDEAIGVGVPG